MEKVYLSNEKCEQNVLKAIYEHRQELISIIENKLEEQTEKLMDEMEQISDKIIDEVENKLKYEIIDKLKDIEYKLERLENKIESPNY